MLAGIKSKLMNLFGGAADAVEQAQTQPEQQPLSLAEQREALIHEKYAALSDAHGMTGFLEEMKNVSEGIYKSSGMVSWTNIEEGLSKAVESLSPHLRAQIAPQVEALKVGVQNSLVNNKDHTVAYDNGAGVQYSSHSRCVSTGFDGKRNESYSVSEKHASLLYTAIAGVTSDVEAGYQNSVLPFVDQKVSKERPDLSQAAAQDGQGFVLIAA